MKRSAFVGVVAAGLLLGAQGVGAAVFDFVDLEANGDSDTGPGGSGFIQAGSLYANGSSYSGQKGEAAFKNFTWVVDGVSLTVTGTKLNGDAAFAYLDAPWSGRPAGLGVCSQGIKTTYRPNQCDPGSDDNLSAAEVLHLNFDNGPERVSFAKSVFRDSLHNVYPDGQPDDARISVDNGATWTQLVLADVLVAKHLDIKFVSGSQQQLYLSSLTTVPAPATLALLGLGLIGMGMAKRKKA